MNLLNVDLDVVNLCDLDLSNHSFIMFINIMSIAKTVVTWLV